MGNNNDSLIKRVPLMISIINPNHQVEIIPTIATDSLG